MKRGLFILSFLLSITISAQVKDFIIGKVKDKENDPVTGVDVSVFQDLQKQKRISSAITDKDGNYKIAIPDTLKDLTIRYSFIGMKSKEFQIKRRKK